MRIFRYVSDIHLELRKTHVHPKLKPYIDFKRSPTDSYYLALLGDIGNPFTPELDHFFKEISPKYDHIFYVPGNHEYYNLDKNTRPMTDFTLKLQEMCQIYPNITLLNNKSMMLGEYKIIGSTLWSHIDELSRTQIEGSLNDYHLIRKSNGNKITIENTNRWNTDAIRYIETEINTADPCIILTHHAPLFSDSNLNQYTASSRYLNTPNNQAFHNNLGAMIKSPIVAWLYGHTHYASAFDYNRVYVGTNQLGYEKEEPNISFNSYAHLDLDTLKKRLNSVTEEEFNTL